MWRLGLGGQSSKGHFKRKEVDIEDETAIQNFLEEFHRTDIYYGTYFYDYKEDGTKILYGDFYLDFDAQLTDNTAYNALKEDVCVTVENLKRDFQLTEKMMLFYFSGSKGFHLIVPAENLNIVSLANLNTIYKTLAKIYQQKAPSIDTQIYDDRRLFRYVNSINGKTGLYKIQLTYEELCTLSYKALCEKAMQPQSVFASDILETAANKNNMDKLLQITDQYIADENKKRFKETKQKSKKYLKQKCLAPCMLNILQETHGQGQRNNTLVVVASSFFQLGCTYEEVLEYLSDWNQHHFVPPLEQIEIERTVQSAHHQVENKICFGCTRIMELGYCTGNCEFTVKGERHDA